MFKLYVQDPYGGGLQLDSVQVGEFLVTDEGTEFEFVGVSDDGKKVLVAGKTKAIEVSPEVFGGEIRSV